VQTTQYQRRNKGGSRKEPPKLKGADAATVAVLEKLAEEAAPIQEDLSPAKGKAPAPEVRNPPARTSTQTRIAEPRGPPRFLRLRAVLDATGLSRSTLYSLMSVNKFPSNFAVTEGCVAWLESEVVAWQQLRLAERNARGVR
jgi:prophage regulatory protein